jgi:hypothetical protein
MLSGMPNSCHENIPFNWHDGVANDVAGIPETDGDLSDQTIRSCKPGIWEMLQPFKCAPNAIERLLGRNRIFHI